MNFDLDHELRQALRRKEPSRDLIPARPRPSARPRWFRYAAAAVVIALLPSGIREYRGREAKQKLMVALRLTGAKLQSAQKQLEHYE